MPKIDLLPCPFCGSSRAKFYRLTGMYEAACSDCRCTTGIECTKEAAAAAWNTRASGWIPCSERLPDEINGKSRIVFASVRHIDTVNLQITWTERGKWYTSGTVTHWMPLPSTPEVTANVE